MLNQLQIQNYAIIDHVVINFDQGLTIITGETGAGKSIILGALGLIMGKRADTKVLFDQNSKCFVEAKFNTLHPEILAILKDEELDQEVDLIIRREISSSGKSRAFVNDTPVNLDVLQRLSVFTIDLHQQWDNLDIHQEDYQMEMLDSFAENGQTLQSYQTLFKLWKAEKKKLSDFEEKRLNANKENEFNLFLLDELLVASLKPEEQEELEGELDILSNAQSILENFTFFNQVVGDQEPSVISALTSVLQGISSIQTFSPDYNSLFERLSSVLEELKDMNREAELLSEKIEFNPDKIQEIKDRLSVLYKLQKKHNVQTNEELLSIQEQLQTKSNDVERLDQEISISKNAITTLEKDMLCLADALNKKRKEMIPPFETAVLELLQLLKMDHAQLQIVLQSKKEFSDNGTDQISWLFSANKGGAFLPLKSVASGGEISRLNLCIKSILAQSMTLPTLVFDEIDAGVSGDVAKKMGELLSSLSKKHQIISITHSPQVASKATNHLFVYKDHDNAKTLTKIKSLSSEERIQEIGIMLSSDPPSAAALEAAKELLRN
ncbi:MAG: DNA repair protein RecN [Saprospiraceae bacterium]